MLHNRVERAENYEFDIEEHEGKPKRTEKPRIIRIKVDPPHECCACAHGDQIVWSGAKSYCLHAMRGATGKLVCQTLATNQPVKGKKGK